MNRKQIEKYFAKRPKAERLFLVCNIVFIDHDQAYAYAGQIGGQVMVHERKIKSGNGKNKVKKGNAAE